ncbi:Collagen alpha-1(VII) chain [Armadillidium nasatum]|uniref:Collagen alpha-1(VII) chain n=1 Tax=Armadillidium nasatum TaxID=96803 RepID=A0A5N5SRK8_9CRUS|nr:Collagen alpha-1(VII) chain [Armadillidium nasatum]
MQITYYKKISCTLCLVRHEKGVALKSNINKILEPNIPRTYSITNEDHNAVKDVRNPICNLEVDQGSCSNPVAQFSYIKQLGVCEVFIYMGCGGNANRFGDFMECTMKCDIKLVEHVKVTNQGTTEIVPDPDGLSERL